jgi:hypothetical protein
MTLTLAVAFNAVLAAGVVAALAYVGRLPYRIDRVVRANDRWANDEMEPPAYERAA